MRRHLVVLALLCPAVAAAQATVGPNLRTIPGPHNEPWLAVSPTNPNVVIAASQQGDLSGPPRMAVSTIISRDGGRTWVPVQLPGAAPTPFDPMVATGPAGQLYVMHGVIGGPFAASILPNAPPKSHIRFWRSTDEGFTWDGPTELASSVDPDHMRMVVDMSNSRTRGRIYVAWNDVADQFVMNNYEVFVQWSDDQGRSFNQPRLVGQGTNGKLVATEPVVLSDGTLLVTYYQYFNPLALRENERMPMFVVRSTDGGRTFSAPEKIFEFGPHSWRDRAVEFGSGFSLPIVTADTSSASPYRDQVYITWHDVSGGTANAWFVRSRDHGKTWSRPLKLNDNPTSPPGGLRDYRIIPVVAVSPAGPVAVAWYDRRDDPNKMCWHYYGAVSLDGGATFSKNFRISTAPSCPPPGLPPSVAVHNVSPRPADPNRLPDAILENRGTIDRLMIRIADENQAARDEANRGLTSSRLTVSFDPARALSPGHYTGLAADRNGDFLAMWLDRRSGMQELYAARVALGDPTTPPGLVESDVSRLVEVMPGTPAFDPAKNSVTVPLQIRNVGSSVIFGPLRVRIRSVEPGTDTTVVFEGKLGTGNRLRPRDVSEPLTVTLGVKPERGFDARFDFHVLGATAPR